MFSVRMDAATPSKMGGANPVTAYLIDGDGPERFMLRPGASAQAETEARLLRVPLFRAGVADTGQVDYTIENGTASNDDYTDLTGGTAEFAPGAVGTLIEIRMEDDGLQEPDETFTITLGEGAASGENTSVLVTIKDNTAIKIEGTNPRTRFHHPRHRLAYRFGDYRIREMHVFASDNLSGVRSVQLGLRQKFKSGRCKWWKAGRFRRGPCKKKVWLSMKRPAYPDGPYYFRLPKLRPSMGTRIRNYTGFARARDQAGNVEVLFKVGRNANTFEVKRG